MLIKNFVLSLFVVAACATARGQAAYDNLSVNPIYGLSTGTSVGESFITGGSLLTLNNVVFPQIAGTPGNLVDGYTAGETFGLYFNSTVTAADGTVHAGPGLAVPGAIFTLSHYQYPTSNVLFQSGLTTASTVAPVVLTAGTRYWLVLSSPSGSTVVNWNYANYDTANPDYYKFTSTGGVGLPATDTSYELNSPTTAGYSFYDYTDGPQSLIINAVPEPSSFCLLGLAGAGAFLLACRARSAKVA